MPAYFATFLAIVLLSLDSSVSAQDFFFHAGTAVPVPGGTTNTFLDQTAPAGATPVILSLNVPKNTSAALPTFTGTAVGGPVLLKPGGVLKLYIQANQRMPNCAKVDFTIVHLDPSGVPTVIGSGQNTFDVIQGPATGEGTALRESLAFLPGITLLQTGESVQVSSMITNVCDANRTIRIGYDAVSAPSGLSFVVPPPSVPSKAKAIKGEFVTAYQQCGSGSTSTNPPVVLPACTAVRANAVCGFGSKGAGKYGATVSKTDVKLSASLSGLTGCDGQTLIALADLRLTTSDCAGLETCTAGNLDDFPVGQCVATSGKCSIKSTVETFLGLGTNVLKNGQTYNIELGEICASAGASKAFCGGLRVGPK